MYFDLSTAACKPQSCRKNNLASRICLALLLCCLPATAHALQNSGAPVRHLTLSANLLPAQVGLSYSSELVASGGTAPYTFTLSSGKLPAGLTLGKSSGTISGTPTASGTFYFSVHVTDSKTLGDAQPFQITVSAPVAVTVTPSSAALQPSGVSQFTSLVTNSSNPAVTWSATSGTISSSGLYQASTANGNSTATITATSVADATKSASASVTITAIPLSVSGSFIPAQVGFNYSVPLTVGNGNAPYTFSISSGQLPAGLTFSTSSGVVSGTPTASGTFNFAVSVTDSKSLSGSQSFQIAVSAAVAVSVTPTTSALQPSGTSQFTAAVTNSSNPSATWSATSGTISSSGLYQASATNANSTATITATSVADPTKSASALVTITAIPLTLSGTFIPAQVGFNYSVPLTVSNGTAPYTFSISSGQLPAGLTFSTSSGAVSGTPTTSGTSTFALSVTDSKGTSGSQTFQIAVSPAVAISVTPTSSALQPSGSSQFTATVTNSSNLAATWSATSGTISSSGLYQAPAGNASSTASVTATSVADPTKSASSSITITAIPLTVSGTFNPAQVDFSYTVPLAVGNGTAPYTFAVSSGQLPAGLTLSSSGTVSGTPTAAGTSNFTINVTDSKNVSGSQAFSLTVSPAVAVTLTPTIGTVASAGTLAFTALVSNTSNTSVTWTDTTGTISTAGLYQAPTVTADSTATITVISTVDPTKSASAYVTVTPPPQPPLVISSTSLSSATAGAAYSDALGATGGKPPYNWTLTSGSLPGGMALQPAGSLAGTTTQSGQFNLTLQVADSSSPAMTTAQTFTLAVNSSTGNGGAIDSTFFGFTENNTSTSNFPTVNFGLQRFWDSPPLQWPSINTASGVFTFTSLDSALAQAYSSGVMQAMYTLARTPTWASSAPSDMTCNYTTAKSGGGGGECDAPNDLNSDGSGANATWKAWISAIAVHANDPTYLQTHAHIGYWEIWNEPDTQAFWGGSIAQLARLTEDANCIITGRGVIHQNGDGTATHCTATAIDPTAKIVMAAAHAKGVALTYGQNELYCNANPTGYRLPCPNPPNAIAAAIDIVNFHMKPGNESGNDCPAPTPCTPESAMQMYISNVKAILQPAELLKPLWNGEASYSKSGFINAYTDTDMKSSFMPRYFLLNWSLGVSALHWYTWESMTPAAVQTSYQQAYNWLYGSMLSMPCTAAGTVWSCEITKSGRNYLIVWDAAQSCSNGSCTTANQIVAPNWTEYQDMTTASTPTEIYGNIVPVGIKPVVLQ